MPKDFGQDQVSKIFSLHGPYEQKRVSANCVCLKAGIIWKVSCCPFPLFLPVSTTLSTRLRFMNEWMKGKWNYIENNMDAFYICKMFLANSIEKTRTQEEPWGSSARAQNIILFRRFPKERSKEAKPPPGAALVCLAFSRFIIYLRSLPLSLLWHEIFKCLGGPERIT